MALFLLQDVEIFLAELRQEIQPYYAAGAGLIEEFDIFLLLCGEDGFSKPPANSLIGTISYCLLLKQYELINAAIRSVISHDYVVCSTLIRSIFETNMILIHLSRNPKDGEDFVEFSDVICNPDIDWTSHGVSRTRRESLEKKFQIRKLIRDLYSGTANEQERINTSHFYQQLCNATHPSLDAASYFYSSGAPPIKTYSSIGIRRTILQLWAVLNSSVEAISGAIHQNRILLDECYHRRAQMYVCHREASAWHALNPHSEPMFSCNQEFKIVWQDSKPFISCLVN